MAILKKYKNTFDNFINSLDIKFSDRPKAIDKRLYNILRSRGMLMKARLKLKRYLLNKTKKSQINRENHPRNKIR